MAADKTNAEGDERRDPLVLGVRLGARAVVVAGFAGLVWLVHRHALWGPVALALLLASLVLAAGAALRRGGAALVLRARLRGQSLAGLDRMSGAAFEDWIVHCLERSGFACENLPRSRDFGVDLIATRAGRRIGVQAKRYDGPVGNGAVQQAIAGAGHHDCALAAVVTQSRFTAAARAQAASADPPVVLIDRDRLVDLGRLLRAARAPRSIAARARKVRADRGR